MKKLFSNIAKGLATILALDFIALCLWFMSGQPLPDGWFYAGSLSAHIIRLFI